MYNIYQATFLIAMKNDTDEQFVNWLILYFRSLYFLRYGAITILLSYQGEEGEGVIYLLEFKKRKDLNLPNKQHLLFLWPRHTFTRVFDIAASTTTTSLRYYTTSMTQSIVWTICEMWLDVWYHRLNQRCFAKIEWIEYYYCFTLLEFSPSYHQAKSWFNGEV